MVERVRDEQTATVCALRQTVGALEASEVARALAAMARVYRAGCYLPSTEVGEWGLWRAIASSGLAQLPCGHRPEFVECLAERLGDYAADYRVVPGMTEVLSHLRARAWGVGVVSNWPPSLPRLLECLGVGPFDVVACSGSLRCTKPDPAIFQWAAAQTGTALDGAWFVGDDPVCDYAPALSLGMRAVLWDPAGKFAGSGMCRAASGSELKALLDATG